jgi:uncharacterized LabA/DUF88 family protein
MHAAVFVDFENLFASLKNRPELNGQRTRDVALTMLENLKARLRSEGLQMVLGRSYAAFDTYPGMEVAHDLALMGFDPQYVLVSPSGKSSSDVQLAVDVCRVIFRRADIETIVIVAGDRDFIPIARQVLEENRGLRMVGIPDATSGDLRLRVGAERFLSALDLMPHVEAPAAAAAAAAQHGNGNGATGGATQHEPVAHTEHAAHARDGESERHEHGHDAPTRGNGDRQRSGRAAIVRHIPVTWQNNGPGAPHATDEQLTTCLDLIVKAQARHGSREVWLSPFLKGAMSHHFSNLVHPERRALVNELRTRGVIRVEERENQFADHPYSVIVLVEEHPWVQAVAERARRG